MSIINATQADDNEIEGLPLTQLGPICDVANAENWYFGAAITAVILLMVCWLIYILWCGNSKQKIHKKIKVIIILFFVSILSSSSCNLAAFIICAMTDNEKHEQYKSFVAPLMQAFWICYYYSLICLSLLFVTRLQNAGYGAKHPSLLCMYGLCILCIIITTLRLIAQIEESMNVDDLADNVNLWVILDCSVVILHLMIGFITLCLFLVKLKNTAVITRESKVFHAYGHSSSEIKFTMEFDKDSRRNSKKDLFKKPEITLNERQFEKIQLMSRYTILVSMALITTVITITPTLYVYINNLSRNTNIDLIISVLIKIDLLINTLCVTLQNKFAVSCYKKLCFICDYLCVCCFQKGAKIEMKEEFDKNNSDIYNNNNNNNNDNNGAKDEITMAQLQSKKSIDDDETNNGAAVIAATETDDGAGQAHKFKVHHHRGISTEIKYVE